MRPVGETLGFLEDAGFEIRGVQALREHYVRTLEAWYASVRGKRDAVAVAMMGEEIARVWRLYLVGALRSFAERRMGVEQILCSRPEESS